MKYNIIGSVPGLQHRKAIKTYLEAGRNPKLLDDFSSLGYSVQDLLMLNKERYLATYQQTFTPIFQIARNMGYEVWK